MTDRMRILSIPFSKLSSSELLIQINKAIENGRQSVLTVLDASMIINMKSDPKIRGAIFDSEIIVADGYYVALALRFLGYGEINQITGFETALTLMDLAKEKGYKIFFFGAEEFVIRKVVNFAENQFDPSIVAGYRNGYFDSSDTPSIVKEINDSDADIVLIGISSPIREQFLHSCRKDLNAPFLMGVGGVFDILGGKTKRAPRWMINCRLEWLFRFSSEPKRLWKRMFYSVPYFVYCVLIERAEQLMPAKKSSAS